MKKLYLLLTLVLAMACIGVVRALIVADISEDAVPLSDLTDGMTVTLRVDHYNNNGTNEYSAINAVLYDPKATDAEGVGVFKMGNIPNDELLESHVWVLEAASAPSGVSVEGAGKWFYLKNAGSGNYLTYKSIARADLDHECEGYPAYITGNAAEAKPWLFAALETGVVELLHANPDNDKWSNLYNFVKDDHVMVMAPITLRGENGVYWMGLNSAVYNADTYGLATYSDWAAYIRVDEVTLVDNPYDELTAILADLSVTEFPIGDAPGCVKPEYAERAAYYNKFIVDLGDYIDDPDTPSSKFGELLTEFKALTEETANFEFLPVVVGYYRLVSAYPEYMNQQEVEKAMYIDGDNLKWKNLDMENSDFIWQVSANADGTELYLSALANVGKYVQKSSTSTQVKVGETLSPVKFEVQGASGQFEIIPNGGSALHTAGHGGGSGASGNIVGWNGAANTPSSWYVRPLADEEQNAINQMVLDAKMADLLIKAKSLMEEATASILISLDTLNLPTAIVQSVDQLSSPATEPAEGALANLLDGNGSTFWHSQWSAPIPAAELHYLQIDLLEARQDLVMAYQCRNGAMNDRPVTFEVTMDNEEDGEFATSVTLTGIDGNDTGMQYFVLCLPAEYRYIRLRATDCWNSSTNNSLFRTYWHAGELNFYEVGDYVIYTQMMNREEDEYKAIAAAVEAAESVDTVTQADVDALEFAISIFRIVLYESFVTFTDGEAYTATDDHTDINVKYTRTFADESWQSMYVPFNMNYDEWAPYADVAKIHNVRGYDTNEDGVIDETVIEFSKVTTGEIVPNVPYIIRPKTTGKVNFLCTGKNLLAAPAEEGSIDCSSTEFVYALHGVYQPKSFSAAAPAPSRAGAAKSTTTYRLSGGEFVATDSETEIAAGSIYLSITSKTGGYTPDAAPARVRLQIIGEPGVVTGVEIPAAATTESAPLYDLTGRRVNSAAKGICIQNGHKVLVK